QDVAPSVDIAFRCWQNRSAGYGLFGRRRFFFFQAEDGIRDDLVTGVQTCALPISPCPLDHARRERVGIGGYAAPVEHALPLGVRSEERRVRKKCCGWAPASSGYLRRAVRRQARASFTRRQFESSRRHRTEMAVPLT